MMSISSTENNQDPHCELHPGVGQQNRSPHSTTQRGVELNVGNIQGALNTKADWFQEI